MHTVSQFYVFCSIIRNRHTLNIYKLYIYDVKHYFKTDSLRSGTVTHKIIKISYKF